MCCALTISCKMRPSCNGAVSQTFMELTTIWGDLLKNFISHKKEVLSEHIKGRINSHWENWDQLQRGSGIWENSERTVGFFFTKSLRKTHHGLKVTIWMENRAQDTGNWLDWPMNIKRGSVEGKSREGGDSQHGGSQIPAWGLVISVLGSDQCFKKIIY